ncbi:MAG TPA: hypothetical protein VMM55_10075 [Thermohalobaculum sp.]|nr:hypothetical protein [Thermohalobaculum sp.]
MAASGRRADRPGTAEGAGIAAAPGPRPPDADAAALRRAFLGWQCRVRQIIMREELGRPGPGIMPAVRLQDEAEPLGHLITVLSKLPQHSKVPEMRHIARRTMDPARRREDALKLMSEMHYQRPDEFSDLLTATFPPRSPGAAKLRAAERVRLVFEAYRQRYDLAARVWRLAEHHPSYQSTWWHNVLFNPALPRGTVILGFEPDWSASSADPDPRPRHEPAPDGPAWS